MIVLDLDGTLTNRDKVITQKNKEMLMKAQKMGKIVVLASGRPTYGVMPLAEELCLADYGGYILSYNGGIIMNCRNREVVFERKLPVEANKRILQVAQDEGVEWLSYQDDFIVTSNPESPYVQLESRINQLRVRKIEDGMSYMDFSVPKILLVDDGDYLALVEGRAKASLGRNFSIYRSEPFFLEILPRGIDKAQCLEQLLGNIGVRRDEMIACGDGYNDLSMIKFAGLGVAMENAVLPVRNAADYVTYSNNDDGVAHVVEKFLLDAHNRSHSTWM